MPDEIKPVVPQAPADGAAVVAVVPVEPPKAQPSGLDGLTPVQLKELYKKSPQMFEEAGIVVKPVAVEPVVAPTGEKPVVVPPAQSAAPTLDGQTINLPTDVPVNRESVDAYLAHAKEIGLSVKQAQAEIDFQAKLGRAEMVRQAALPKQKTAQEIAIEEDTANVVRLKADPAFGPKYEENMAKALRAAIKFGDKELLEKLKTSDPVLVKHFWKLGKADAEDTTRGAPNRNGTEGDDVEEQEANYLKSRFPNSPSMFK